MAELETPDAGDSIITLSHMPQQLHAWKADDDWTGVVDRKERRKLQNRQNQRKWRERKKATTKRAQDSPGSSCTLSDSGSSQGSSATLAATEVAERDESDTLACRHMPAHALNFLREFEASVRESYLRGSPQVEHLMGLQRLNVHRAIHDNILAIGMTVDWMAADDAVSIFNVTQPLGRAFNEESIPVSLRPTEIQRAIPHHPWLDFFPFPVMRDYMITAAHLFDDDELCHDLMAFWDTRNSGATLLVWGQPWDPRNWEVTEGFLRKWGWLLRGSPELVVSTNYWRRRRGEMPLVWRDRLVLE
ncbi:hypothetical protein BJX99DRAFT_265810 [Aspergillus californicus]